MSKTMSNLSINGVNYEIVDTVARANASKSETNVRYYQISQRDNYNDLYELPDYRYTTSEISLNISQYNGFMSGVGIRAHLAPTDNKLFYISDSNYILEDIIGIIDNIRDMNTIITTRSKNYTLSRFYPWKG